MYTRFILAVGGLHFTLEALRLWQIIDVHEATITFTVIPLLYIPVAYAALNFGFEGSLATILLCVLLTLPDVVLLHSSGARFVAAFQLGVFGAVASFIGMRVDREQRARRSEEAAVFALRLSEAKYRSLFVSSPVPILVADDSRMVVEANPAAGNLFGVNPVLLTGRNVEELTGQKSWTSDDDLHGGPKNEHLTIDGIGGSRTFLIPATGHHEGVEGQPIVQIILRDVTEERRRQAGLRAYAAHIVAGQEEAYRQIARELHDEVVQQLILLCRRLDIIDAHGEVLPNAVVEEVGAARKTTEEAIRWLRDFARTLRPPALDDLGVVASIRRLLADLSERTAVDGRLSVSGQEARVDQEVELALFRIAQEALRNVERHALASSVAVKIIFSDHLIQLEVIDNGVGCDVTVGDDFAGSGHLGLLGMTERAAALNGTLEIITAQNAGTTVLAKMPRSSAGTPDADFHPLAHAV